MDLPGKPRTRWQTKALPENLDPEWKEERESLGFRSLELALCGWLMLGIF